MIILKQLYMIEKCNEKIKNTPIDRIKNVYYLENVLLHVSLSIHNYVSVRVCICVCCSGYSMTSAFLVAE